MQGPDTAIMLTQQLLTRCQAQRMEADDGTPTDDVVLKISRLDRFLKPHVIQQPTDSGWRVRVEWLGYYEDGEGADLFQVRNKLLNQIANRAAEEGGEAEVVTKHEKDDPPIF